ncbi:MAG: biosynthetic-type acetolactate synthase large subunit [Deltaproteobacteria bacterium]
MAKTNGTKKLFDVLIEEGISTVFCPMEGDGIKFQDFISKDSANSIRFVAAVHEQAASHMADGYARASGKPGIVLCSRGASAINTVTGLATAQMDSSPIIVFIGHFPSPWGRSELLEETDIIGITRSCTKHNFTVKDPQDLPAAVRKAIHIASTGRPSPVVVEIAENILAGEHEFLTIPSVNLRGYKPTLKGNPKQVKLAAEMILASKRPVVFGGGGIVCSGATDELVEFAERLNIPVALTLMGIGSFPPDDPHYINWIGMHGAYCANMAVHDSDLVISIGARFDDRATGGNFAKFAPNAKIIHIDVDPSTIDKNIRVHCPIIGDAKTVIGQLLDAIPADTKLDTGAWFAKIREWDRKHPLRHNESTEKIQTTHVIKTLSDVTGGSATVVSDVGQHQMWVAQFYKFSKPRTHITSGGLGTMGFGFPASIGAKFALPDEQVISVSGDGSFQMNMQELSTAVINNMDLKLIVLNNRHHGMVRQWQTMFFNQNYSASYFEVLPDFVKVAESFGAKGILITKPEEMEGMLREGLSTPGVVLMEIIVDCEEMVYPMIAPGGAMNEMILGAADVA